MKTIALLHPHGGMGDLLLSYPVIDAFTEAFPDHHLLYVTPPKMESVIQSHPRGPEVISLKSGFNHAMQLSKALRDRNAVIGCALWTTAQMAWILKLANVPIRIGQADRLLYSFLFTHRVKVRSASGDAETHWVDSLLDYPRALGLTIKNKKIKVTVPQQVLRRVESLLSQSGLPLNQPFVVMHCGKGEEVLKRGWPIELFASVADQLSQNQLSVVFTGSAAEIPLVQAIRGKTASKNCSIAGKTDFLELAGVLEKAQVAICPDSGPMHAAAAVGTPVVALFAMKTDFPKRWAPWDVDHVIIRPNDFPCRPWCTKETCPDFRCYNVLEPKAIVEAVLKLKLPLPSKTKA